MNGRTGALNDLKIIDLTRVLGGPYCTQILGDNGAEIIKIEPPQGDETRNWGPPFRDGESAYFMGVNRNKKSIALDLRVQGGREVLLRLLEDADILIENYKTGSMERWGLGYEEVLKERFPSLIHLRISGYGADGPYGGLPGYDGIVQAVAGMMSVNGEPQSGRMRIGVPLVDLGTGLFSAIALLAAIHERHKSGLGQYIDMALYDSAVAFMHPHVGNNAISDEVPGLTGNSHPNLAPYDKFQTQTCEIFLGAGNNRAFRFLCESLGCVELLEDSRFRENSDRLENKDILFEILENIMAGVDGHQLAKQLSAAGIACGPLLDTDEVMSSELTAHRDMVFSKDGYTGFGNPVKLQRTPGKMQCIPPRFSEHAREILENAGFTTAEIETLIEQDVVVMQRR
jgi:crotonobetainyl-CoA:carnitine CoA-transferase CaiB-like acyl-CoA transferase